MESKNSRGIGEVSPRGRVVPAFPTGDVAVEHYLNQF